MKNKAWTPEENRAVVALYFAMLDKAVSGEKYNKAAMVRRAQLSGDETLGYRSRGSIEAKLMNCSAAHRDLNPEATTMDGFGYRALSNYQAALREEFAVVWVARDADFYRAALS